MMTGYELLRDKEIFLEQWYRGSPDSTNFAHPGNRTIEKIVLNGDLFSTKISHI